MNTEQIAAGAEQLPVGKLKGHPLNPRKGNVRKIADSLQVNGQYRPIVVNRRTGYIVAGNHTWKAAKSLGWETIGVTYIDVDDRQEVEILLADNRASDAGYTDEATAFGLLASLPDLAGTGYELEDLKLPEMDLDAIGFEPDDGESGAGAGEEQDRDEPLPEPDTVPFWVGNNRGSVQRAPYEAWRAGLPKRPSEAFKALTEALGLVEQDTQPAPQPDSQVDVQVERIDSLVPYPDNPQQGDIGTIGNLLRSHGQYRPIVVNRRTRRILAGNHVAMAAESIGWDHIGVSWVDVDDEGEKRIVLVDNRTAALAEYDTQALAQALLQVPMQEIELATGFSLEDVEALVSGGTPAKAPAKAEAWLRVGTVKGKVREGLLKGLNLTAGQELLEVAAMLGLEGVQP